MTDDKDDKYVSVFSNGEVWISAKVILEALETIPTEGVSPVEIVETLKFVVNKVESETFNFVSKDMLEKAFETE